MSLVENSSGALLSLLEKEAKRAQMEVVNRTFHAGAAFFR